MATRIGAIAFACLLAFGSVAAAQDTASSFLDLARLVKPGDVVTVSDSTGATTNGTIAELTASSLVLRMGAERREYAEPEVTRIRQRRQDSLLNGLLIGAGSGAAFGALGAAGCANDFGCSDSTAAFLALGIGVGAGIGLGIDAAIVRERIIFDRFNRPGVTLSMAPVIGRGHASAALSLRF